VINGAKRHYLLVYQNIFGKKNAGTTGKKIVKKPVIHNRIAKRRYAQNTSGRNRSIDNPQ
jgi:hypothetical protein